MWRMVSLTRGYIIISAKKEDLVRNPELRLIQPFPALAMRRPCSLPETDVSLRIRQMATKLSATLLDTSDHFKHNLLFP